MLLPRRECGQKFLIKIDSTQLDKLNLTRLKSTQPLVLDTGREWLHEVATGEDNNRHACSVCHDGHGHHVHYVVKEKERKYLEKFF